MKKHISVLSLSTVMIFCVTLLCGCGTTQTEPRITQVAIIDTLLGGMYDGSGTYAVEVGIPTKSGVGGGLLAVSDKRAGIGVFGPSLDPKGNSIAGCRLLKEIATKLRLSLFYDTEFMKAVSIDYSLTQKKEHQKE